MRAEPARREGNPSGQGEDSSTERLGGRDPFTQSDAGCLAGQVVRHHLYRQPGAVGGEAPRGHVFQPDAVLEVSDGVLDLGVAAMVCLHLSQNPLLYVFFWKTGTLTGTLAIAFTIYRRHALHRPLWSAWLHAIRKPGFALMCLGHTDILLLTLAAHHIPISIGVIILQLSPILFIWTMWLTHRQTATYMCPDRTTLALSLTALAGVALAVYSEHGTLSTTLDTGLMLGTVICLDAALLGAMNALSIRVGRDVHATTPTSPIILATIIGYPITIAAGNPTVPQTALLIAGAAIVISVNLTLLFRQNRPPSPRP